jgi:hypothetical protein
MIRTTPTADPKGDKKSRSRAHGATILGPEQFSFNISDFYDAER